MTDKMFLTVCLTAVGTLVGYLIGRRLKQRKEYFRSLDGLLARFESTLNFSRDTVPTVLGEYKSPSPLLNSHIEACLAEMRGEKAGKFKAGCLTKSESDFAHSVISSLGRYNAAAEKSAIATGRVKLKEYGDAADDKYAKLGKPSIKLGFLFGLLLSVLCW